MNKENTKKMKDSGIAWLGEIPQGWEVLKFKFLYKASMGCTILAQDLIENGKIPVYSATESDKIFGYVNESSVILEKNDIIIPARGNSIGNLMIVKEEKATSTQTTIYAKKLSDNKSNIDFIFHYCKSLANHLFKFEVTAIPQITVGQVKENPILIPPLETQTRIANYLDKKTSQIGKFIDDKKKMIELLKEQKQAIIHQATTKGIDKNVKMKDSGIAWLGDIPQGWEVRRLKYFSNIKRGASPRPIDDPKYFDENGEFSWVRISDVTASKIYLNKTEQKLSVLGASLSVKQYCGDLFLSIAGTVGKPIIAGIKCCIHDGFVSFSNLSNRVNKMFLFYILDSGNAYSGLGKEGSQLNLNIDTVANISIPLPPLETQTRIANYLDKKTSQIDTAIKKIEQEIELVEEYKKSLIYHATTGKIDISKNQTQPIQTKLSQTQPSQTQPN